MKKADNPSEIIITFTDGRYALLAKQAKLSEVLSRLGKTADFKFRTFETLDIERKNWRFDSMPFTQLLTNLVRGYSTVMLYEEAQDKTPDSDNRKLKELWLMTRENNVELADQSMVNIEIELEQTATLSSESENLTIEQQYEISHINNLEGLTGDDVIETLKQTLVTEKDPVIRKRAVIALSNIGGTGVLDALESGLGDRSGEVRSELARSFAQIKDQKSMLALGQLLIGDIDVKVRQEAVRALYQQNSHAAYSFVEAALKDNEESVRKVAEEILQHWVLTPENN